MSRPPNREFQEWWNKQRATGHDLLDDKSNGSTRSFLTIDIQTVPSDGESVEKERVRSARQLSWLCLLRFQQIASSLAWLSNGFLSLLRTANRRIASPDSLSDSKSSRLYRVIKVFLIVVLILLVFELVAYFKGWHFSPPKAHADVYGMIGLIYAKWLEIRADYLAPPLQSLTNMCIVLFLVQSIDRVILILGCCWIKFRRLKPVAPMEYPTNAKNEDVNVQDYPMVLVQIPMCNEREVRRCGFHTPSGRFLLDLAIVVYVI